MNGKGLRLRFLWGFGKGKLHVERTGMLISAESKHGIFKAIRSQARVS